MDKIYYPKPGGVKELPPEDESEEKK